MKNSKDIYGVIDLLRVEPIKNENENDIIQMLVILVAAALVVVPFFLFILPNC